MAVATKVNDGIKTSSPFLIPSAYYAACNAAVPEFTEITYFDFTKVAADFSKDCTYLPPTSEDEVRFSLLSTEVTAEISSLPRIGMLIGIFNDFYGCSQSIKLFADA